VFTPLVAPGRRGYYSKPVSSYSHFLTEVELALNDAAQAALPERAAAATGNKFGKPVPDFPITAMTGLWECP
jgi:hypothetical protein